jgi:hypothetical protein
MYDKHIQTVEIETEAPEAFEDKIRQELIDRQKADAQLKAEEKALEEEAAKLDQEIEQEVRGGWTVPRLNKPPIGLPRTFRRGTGCFPLRP